MSQTQRIYKIDQLLAERRVIGFEVLRETLEVSRATLKRDLAYMRDRLNAPIHLDRELGG
jgi:DeoR/GlpR family transcriptional regulator of sugar metabolism